MAGTARKPQTKDEETGDLTERKEGEKGHSKTSTKDGSDEEQQRYITLKAVNQSASGGRRDDHQRPIFPDGPDTTSMHSGWLERVRWQALQPAQMAGPARKPQTKRSERQKEGEEVDSMTKSTEDGSDEQRSRYQTHEIALQSASGGRRGDRELFAVRQGDIRSVWHERAETQKGITTMDRVKQSLKAHLWEKFSCIHEGGSASRSRLEDVYTRLYITQQTADYGCRSHEILDQFKFQHDIPSFFIEDYEQISCLNIFKPGRIIPQKQSGTDKPIRTVMTKGMAGIGKTVTVQKFSLNWAEGQSNQHIDFLFVLPFRELNLLRDGEYSLLQLLVSFYPELDSLENMQEIAHTRVLFVFDGLDESRFALDFKGSARVTEVTQQSTVPVLLTNLIRGTLLPEALLWVTSRPAAASQVPSQYIDQVTEVQGFTDHQKVEYFKKRFNADQAKEVLSCLSGMLSFHFMGHMPIFCWITAEVFREGWSDRRSRKITTMTELYIYYLRIQTQRAKQKYGKRSSVKAKKKVGKSRNAALLLNLSRLAFEHLLKGNLIFYEEDLRECGIETDDASVFCGFCSEILSQERGLFQRKIFSFVHLSFQEFLAALYAFHSCVTRNDNALKLLLSVEPTDLSLLELQRRVVDKALQSENGQLDMFLCFFLGFLLRSNQTILEDLLPHAKSSSDTAEEMKSYLRTFNAGNISQERCMNLFICKFELSEERFQDDIRLYLDSGVRLSSVDCSVLSTLLQLSGEVIDDLDLTKCYTPLVGTEKLVQLMKKCKRAALKSQHLTDSCLHILVSILHSTDSCLRELSLVCVQRANVPLPFDLLVVLGDSKLETLRLSGYSLDFKCCHWLTSILQFKQSSLKALDLKDCIYSYPQDYSGYKPEAVQKTEEYEDFSDELTLLTVIPAALIGPVSQLEEFSMAGCHLTSKCCQVFASVLCSNSNLRVLDLSRNNLQDLGVQLLSVGLGSSKCRLEILRLSCCGVTEEGCVFLASALKSNPSHLRELDLSFNHPGKSGVELLSERLQDPECRMEKLNVDQNEEHWVNPQLLHKYACDITLDPNTANEYLLLSEHNRKVDRIEEKQSHPDHPDRFDDVQQVMSVEGLTGRCYWEVKWAGLSNIGVAYKSLKRKGHDDAEIEYSSKAWTFNMNVWNGYSFFHMRKETFVPVSLIDVQAFLSRRRRLGLFLDWPAGLLSFYSLCGDTKTLLHTFHATFTEPVHPVFTIVAGSLTLSSAAKLRKDGAPSSFTPEVVTEKMCVSYRFTFPSSGLFQCSLTGLVFKVTDKGEVYYKTQIWDPVVLEAAGKVPGGPLFNIKTSQNLICQLHLPHCEPEPALVSESLSVVHITEDGMSIIKPREITQTHVVVDTAHLSAFGLVWDIVERFVNLVTKPVNGQVLLFSRRSHRGNDILCVILLPSNVPLPEVKAHHKDCKNIPAPSYCLLHKEQYYSLLSDPEGFRIQPRRTRFFENYGPNFHASFEVTLATSTEEMTLLVQDADRMQQVWEYSLPLPVSPSPASMDEHESVTRKKTSAKEKLQRTRAQFVERVSDPVLDKLLDELQSHGVLPDSECEAYRVKSKADKARNVIDTVRKKGEDASSIMIKILSKNDPYLCKELEFG